MMFYVFTLSFLKLNYIINSTGLSIHPSFEVIGHIEEAKLLGVLQHMLAAPVPVGLMLVGITAKLVRHRAEETVPAVRRRSASFGGS